MTSAIRMRNLIATTTSPSSATIRRCSRSAALRSADRRIAGGVQGGRETTGDLLDRLSDADWKREGTHTEHGRYGMDTWLGIYSVTRTITQTRSAAPGHL